MEENVIHCIGDSHISFFAGYNEIQPVYPEPQRNKFDYFKTYRLGAVLAYSLNRLGTKERGREKLLQVIYNIKRGSTILLGFGEIDCRCHLIKEAYKQNLPIEIVVENCVKQYFEVVDELLQLNFQVYVWGVPPATNHSDPIYPTFGTMHERNQCSRIFNNFLEKECLTRRLRFISIFPYLSDKKNNTNLEYYFDSIHLGQVARPLMLRELRKTGSELIKKKYPSVLISVLLVFSFFYRKIRVAYQYIFPENVRSKIAKFRKEAHLDYN